MVNEVKLMFHKLTKTNNNSSYTEIGTVEAMINQVDMTQLSLYPDLPTGTSFEMTITNFNYSIDIQAGDKFVVANKYQSQFDNNDEFIVYLDFQKQKILGNLILKGVVIKQ